MSPEERALMVELAELVALLAGRLGEQGLANRAEAIAEGLN